MPFCAIVPPYILSRLAQSEPRAGHVAEAAKLTLELTARLGAERRKPPVQTLEETARAIERACVRIIYDERGHTQLPGARVRSEGDAAIADCVVDEAYDAAGIAYAFFDKVFDRNSIDGRGMHLVSSVHYARDFDNAFWNGRQMVYGDGDGKAFTGFTTCLDIIGHELAHGITQHECGLAYEGQAGALNESISDVFGSLLKQWHRKQNATKRIG